MSFGKASTFPDALLSAIRQEIIDKSISANPIFNDLVFSSVNPETGKDVVDSLLRDEQIERINPRINFNSVEKVIKIRVMSTIIHNVHQDWFKKELDDMRPTFLNQAEYDTLLVRVGTTFKNFAAPYELSSKEPDLCLIPSYQQPLRPTIVMETQWGESPRLGLSDDAKLWLLGGQPEVQMVITICWSLVDGHIKGTLTVYERDMNGALLERQAETIFPVPHNTATQSISITRGQLLGRYAFPGRDEADTWHLSLNKLRAVAIPCIQAMGFTASQN